MTFLEESGTRTQIPLAHTLTGSAAFKPGKAGRAFHRHHVQHAQRGRDLWHRLSRSERDSRPHRDERPVHQRHQPRDELRVGARVQAHLRRQGTQAVGRGQLHPRYRRRTDEHRRPFADAHRPAGGHDVARDAARVGAPDAELREGRLRAAAVEGAAPGNRIQGGNLVSLDLSKEDISDKLPDNGYGYRQDNCQKTMDVPGVIVHN